MVRVIDELKLLGLGIDRDGHVGIEAAIIESHEEEDAEEDEG